MLELGRPSLNQTHSLLKRETSGQPTTGKSINYNCQRVKSDFQRQHCGDFRPAKHKLCHPLCHQGCHSAGWQTCQQASLGCFQASRGLERATPGLQGSHRRISRLESSHKVQSAVSWLLSKPINRPNTDIVDWC